MYKLLKLNMLMLSFCAMTGIVACETENPPGPEVNSQSHWMKACMDDTECGGGYACVCGFCSLPCDGDEACGGSEGQGVCTADDSTLTESFCKDTAPEGGAGLCIPPEQAVVPDMGTDMETPDLDDPDVAPDLPPQPEECILPAPEDVTAVSPVPVGALTPSLVKTQEGWAAAWRDGQYGEGEMIVAVLDDTGALVRSARFSSFGQVAEPQLAYAAAEDTLAVAWTERREGERQVALQVLSMDLEPVSAVRRPGDATIMHSAPALVWGAGAYFLSWYESGLVCCPEEQRQVYQMARFDVAGENLGAASLLSDVEGFRDPVMLWAQDTLVLSWVENGEVWLGRFSAEGVLRGPLVQVSEGADASHPAIAWNQAEGDLARYAIAWEDWRHEPLNIADLYVASADSLGVVLVPEMRLTTENKHATFPSLRWAQDRYQLTWSSNISIREPAYLRHSSLDPDTLVEDTRRALTDALLAEGGMRAVWDGPRQGVIWSSQVSDQVGTHTGIQFLTTDEQAATLTPTQVLTPATQPVRLDVQAVAGSEGMHVWIEDRGLPQSEIWAAAPDQAGALVELDLLSNPLELHAVTGEGQVGLAWIAQDSNRVLFTRLTPAGGVLVPFASEFSGRPAPDSVGEPSLSWDGEEFILTWREQAADDQGRVFLHRISVAGQPVGESLDVSGADHPVMVPVHTLAPWGLAVAWISMEDAPSLRLARRDGDGEPLGESQVLVSAPGLEVLPPTMLSWAQSLSIAWVVDGAVNLQVFDAEGEVSLDALKLPGAAAISAPRLFPLAGHLAVVWQSDEVTLQVVQVALDGEIVETLSLPLMPGLVSWSLNARAGGAELVQDLGAAGLVRSSTTLVCP